MWFQVGALDVKNWDRLKEIAATGLYIYIYNIYGRQNMFLCSAHVRTSSQEICRNYLVIGKTVAYVRDVAADSQVVIRLGCFASRAIFCVKIEDTLFEDFIESERSGWKLRSVKNICPHYKDFYIPRQ